MLGVTKMNMPDLRQRLSNPNIGQRVEELSNIVLHTLREATLKRVLYPSASFLAEKNGYVRRLVNEHPAFRDILAEWNRVPEPPQGDQSSTEFYERPY